MTITGLVPCTRYYFALKTLDHVGNMSARSNTAAAKTPCVPGFSAGPGETEPAGSDESSSDSTAPPRIFAKLPPELAGQTGWLELFDLAGRRVRRLSVRAGTRGLVSWWDGRDESGQRARGAIYFARLRIGGRELVSRVAVLEP